VVTEIGGGAAFCHRQSTSNYQADTAKRKLDRHKGYATGLDQRTVLFRGELCGQLKHHLNAFQHSGV
jgi:hypothetical protein